MQFIDWIGRNVLHYISHLAQLYFFLIQALMRIPIRKSNNRNMMFHLSIRQIIFTGIDSLPFVTVIALIVGAGTIIQSNTVLSGLGGAKMIGTILIIVVIRELGPLLIAFIIIGRSCSAICTEIGYMKVRSEIEALEVQGIDPIYFIVMPRVVGITASTVFLIVYFDLISIMGGFFIAKLSININFTEILSVFINLLTFTDLTVSIIKGIILGFIISISGCYYGFSVRSSMTEVPQQASKAIINSITLCFKASLLITSLSYL